MQPDPASQQSSAEFPRYDNIVILTGAGLSAESGIATFRDASGVWAKYDYRDVATPEGFAANPELVQAFYNDRRAGLNTVEPNAAHIGLAKLEAEHPGTVTIVTQNVDDLHERAGSQNLIHMHGELRRALCAICDARCTCHDDLSADVTCQTCGQKGGMRPDVVWFGEMPYHMDRIEAALCQADLFISIGTSGNVYPAAGFVASARQLGAHTIELNLEPSEGISLFAEAIHGPASQVVPDYVARLLAASLRA
ncbi:MAG: NAD-dependent deacylase [Pseudomonadota bacterium]